MRWGMLVVRRWPFPLLACGAIATFVHCKSDPSEGALESDHTAGDLAGDTTPYAWAESDLATYEKASTPFGAGTNMPADDPMTVRLQQWVDALDAIARTTVLAKTGRALVAPHPTVVVLNSKVRNAWSSSVNACLGGPVDLSKIPAYVFRPADGGVAQALDAAPAQAPDIVSITDRNAYLQSGACLDPKNWPSRGEALRWTNDRNGADGGTPEVCRLEEADGGLVLTGAVPDASIFQSCHKSAWHGVSAEATSAPQAILRATSSFIHFTTTMLASLKDEKLAFMFLAHELGHYYRAHASGLDDAMYFYEQKSPPEPGKPTKVIDSDVLRSQLWQFMTPMPPPAIFNAKLSPRLRKLMVAIVRHLGANAQGDADAACAGLARSLTPELEGVLQTNQFVFGAQAAAYLDLEARFLDCATRVEVGDAAGAQLEAEPLRSLLLRLFMAGYRTPIGPGNVTLASLFAQYQTAAHEDDIRADVFLAGLNARHLGIYTHEQEADDISLELVSALGLDPKAYVDAYAGYIEATAADPLLAKSLGNDGIMPNSCLAMYRAGWKSVGANGAETPWFAPLGDLSEPHHGYCYRLFNMSREREAHGHVATGTLPTFEPSWDVIRASAASAVATLGDAGRRDVDGAAPPPEVFEAILAEGL